MDMDFSPADLAFREEVRAFLKDNLPERLRDGARRTPGVFVEPDIGMEWHRILFRQGWVAPHWPKEDGGTGWSPTQKFIFEKECALAGAPSLAILGLRLVGPVICEFGTPEQKARFLPGILSGDDYWCQGYSEPGSGSDLASLKTRADRDGDQAVLGATVQITTGYVAGQDSLSVAALAKFDVDATTAGQLVFTVKSGESATISDLEAALRQVKFDNSSETPTTGTRTVTFTVTVTGSFAHLHLSVPPAKFFAPGLMMSSSSTSNTSTWFGPIIGGACSP